MKLKPNTQLLCIDDSKQKVLIKGATYTVSENVHHAELSQSNGDVDLSGCPHFRALFPKAKTVTFYYHWFFGYDVLVVDGEFRGELDSVNELLSFHYHTGCNFKDIDDLRDQYYTFLEEYDRWSFLP